MAVDRMKNNEERQDAPPFLDRHGGGGEREELDLTNGRRRVDGTVRGTVRRRPTLPRSRSGPANVPVSSTLPSVQLDRRSRIIIKSFNRRIGSPLRLPKHLHAI